MGKLCKTSGFFVIAAMCICLVRGQCGFQGPCAGPGLTTRSADQLFSTTTVQDVIYTSSNIPHTVVPHTFSPKPPVQHFFQPKASPATPPPRIFFPDEYASVSLPTESFNSKLFQLMSAASRDRNLCYSPHALQALLTFIYTLSEGKLLQELSGLLDLPSNRTQVAKTYRTLTEASLSSNENNTLILANKIYFDQRYGNVNQDVRNFAALSFATELEPLDFRASSKAADIINIWVAEKTRHLIKQIISPDTLQSDVSALLINSLYFKSEWQMKFSPYDTDRQSFFINSQQQVPVDMMYNEDIFSYGEFDQLGATVLEMPYQLDDFSMMIILPKQIDGLADVERRLSKLTLKLISYRLQKAEVIVKLPKFRVEYDMDMVQPLQQLGLHSLFNADARINLFKDQQKPLVIDQIKHKTFIDVNEAGTEAAAVTFAKFVPLSIPIRIKHFTADHPFIFVIRNSKTVYFMGHVTSI